MSFDQYQGMYVVTDGTEYATPSEVYAFGDMGDSDSYYSFYGSYDAGYHGGWDTVSSNSFTYYAGNNEDPEYIYSNYHEGLDYDHYPVELLDFSSLRGGSRGVIDLNYYYYSSIVTVIGSDLDEEIYYSSDAGGLLDGNGGNDYIGSYGYHNDTIRGGDGRDTIHGNKGDDEIWGGANYDTISGGDGNDTVWGDDGRDVIFLGNGADIFHDNDQGGRHGHDKVYGGTGSDTLNGAGGNDSLYGGGDPDVIAGGIGNDRIHGEAGYDRIRAGEGDDIVRGGDGKDVIHLEGGDDLFHDNNQNDQHGGDKVYGGTGNDTLNGAGGRDTLFGGNGKDSLFGGDNNDTLNGGLGTDVLSGGSGHDTFVFNGIAHSQLGAGKRDVITDFASGDHIGLAPIDADTSVAGNQAFDFSGTQQQANSVWYVNTADGVLVRGDNDGDGIFDFVIEVQNVTNLTADDFIL